MDFSNYVFRASSIGKIMSDGKSAITDKQLQTIEDLQSKSVLTGKQSDELARLLEKKNNPCLGDTCTSYLKQCHREAKYGRKKFFSNKYIEKGLNVEEDGITLLSRVKKTFYKKNDKRLTNEYVTGEPDLFQGPEIQKAYEGTDIKCSWDLFTFPYAGDRIDSNYYWQAQTYMALTCAAKWTIVYCLIDTPEQMIWDEKRKLMWKMGVTTEDDPLYQEAVEALEKTLTFEDIPLQERIIEFPVVRDDAAILKIYDRVKQCRGFLTENFS